MTKNTPCRVHNFFSLVKLSRQEFAEILETKASLRRFNVAQILDLLYSNTGTRHSSSGSCLKHLLQDPPSRIRNRYHINQRNEKQPSMVERQMIKTKTPSRSVLNNTDRLQGSSQNLSGWRSIQLIYDLPNPESGNPTPKAIPETWYFPFNYHLLPYSDALSLSLLLPTVVQTLFSLSVLSSSCLCGSNLSPSGAGARGLWSICVEGLFVV